MKLLIIGCNGQLGSDFVSLSKSAGHDVIAMDYPQVDITNHESLMQTVISCKAEVIVNCAAFTNVDLCETKVNEAYELNAAGPLNLALCAKETDSLLIHFSTDYVFNGLGSRPYTETDTPSPLTVYGKSKLEGEKNISGAWNKHMIFRIAWLYGINGSNFVKTIREVALKKSGSNEPLKVVSDQKGTPTWTVDVSNQVLDVMQSGETGIFHCTSEGECSWYDFAVQIVKATSIDIEVQPCTTSEFPRPAQRPHYSVLENRRLVLMEKNLMPHWIDGFRKFLQTEKNK